MSDIPHENFHEVWWIWADPKHDYGGLRIAHFRKTNNGALIVMICDEPDERRGVRVWGDVAAREGWRFIEPIPIPAVPYV
jgi:hypothetical protein